jgi:hypothetical protein
VRGSNLFGQGFFIKGKINYSWEILEPALQWNATERRRQGYACLRDEVFPRGEPCLESPVAPPTTTNSS